MNLEFQNFDNKYTKIMILDIPWICIIEKLNTWICIIEKLKRSRKGVLHDLKGVEEMGFLKTINKDS